MFTDLKETCPKRGCWCSFRLVDEHGCGKPYAGLDYTVHDSFGVTYTGILDADGYGRVENFYNGPAILDLSTPYFGLDGWYRRLQTRDSFPLPITALQVAAEQTPTGPRKDDGRTYLARERAEKEDAVFWHVEVSDFVHTQAAHLPHPDDTRGQRPSTFLKEACLPSCDQLGAALSINSHNLRRQLRPRFYRTSEIELHTMFRTCRNPSKSIPTAWSKHG